MSTLKNGDLRHRLNRQLFKTPHADLTREIHELKDVVNTLQQKLNMAVALPSTHHSHLDPSDLRLHLTSRSSYGRKYRSAANPTFDPKEKGGEHMTRSGSCYRRNPSVKDSTNSSLAQAAKAETLRRSIHRKKTPEFRTRERDLWKIVPRDHCPERSPPREGSGYPLSEAIEKAKLPPNFRMPQCDLYGGTRDLGEHVYQFETNMLLLQVLDVVMCRAFPTTLRKAALAWFKSLQPKSVYSFGQLSDLFQKHFVSSHSRRKNLASLLNVVQEKNESLACFLGRFNVATLEIDNLDESVKYIAFLRGLQFTSKFAFSVNKSPPGGSSGKSRKAYAREVCITSQNPSKKQKTARAPIPTISFSDEDLKDVKTLHDDPLVITIKAGNFEVKHVLVDNGSFVEILFYDAFKKMNISTDRLQKMDTPLYGFSNHPVAVEGIIVLLVAIGTPPTQANLMLDFMVVKVPSTYNAILGRPALNQLQAVVSTYHLKMKFPTEYGIEEVKGDQTTAHQCYVTSCRSKNNEVFIIEDLREDIKMQRGEPVENLVSIEVYPGEEDKTVRIGLNLKEDTKLELVNLLRTYADVFAWTATDMPKIDPEVITHKLNVNPSKKTCEAKEKDFRKKNRR
ncbi:hypothetical protein RJ639_034887 [Escallonia herrerae]|uniref:Retrotransposon gag domain-containing protein n=1 Tax=Escallonia herrerae TaxID=1293975 RepID=A0AA88WN47_9ASTE|nr:hypothetical protein RJ639_034887 [Escallonia herrerae]